MTEKERFTVDSDGKYWDKINHKYVNLDYLFRLVEELDSKLDNKQYTINEMVKTLRTYDDAYIDLNKKYKKLIDENEQLKQSINDLKETIIKITTAYQRKHNNTIVNMVHEMDEMDSILKEEIEEQ